MLSAAKLAANRANARKSTGPRTPAGRAAVCLNALKHGLTSLSPLAPGEDPAEFQAFSQQYISTCTPSSSPQEDLVLRIAANAWRLRRIYALEAACHRAHFRDVPGLSPAARLALAHSKCAVQIDSLSRHEVRLQRANQKALLELERLQSPRPTQLAKTDFTKQTQPDSAAAAKAPDPCPLTPCLQNKPKPTPSPPSPQPLKRLTPGTWHLTPALQSNT